MYWASRSMSSRLPGGTRWLRWMLNAFCEQAANEPQPEPDPHLEGIDWIRTDDGDLCHPLQHRCLESSLKFWNRVDELDVTRSEHPDVVRFITEFQVTGAKLAGALNGIAEGRDPGDDAFTGACLKRALGHLHLSLSGLDAAKAGMVLPAEMSAEA
jgi:hypothetical protein